MTLGAGEGAGSERESAESSAEHLGPGFPQIPGISDSHIIPKQGQAA